VRLVAHRLVGYLPFHDLKEDIDDVRVSRRPRRGFVPRSNRRGETARQSLPTLRLL